MTEIKQDRRIGRTRQLLQKALVDLILEKGYDAITVQDILDRANVGRSTFYAHYRDKEDLLLKGFGLLMDAFQAQYLSENNGRLSQESARSITLMVFHHAAENRQVFKAMFGDQGGEVVLKFARKYLSQIAEIFVDAMLGNRQPKIPKEIGIHYAVSSFLSLMTWWLDVGFAMSPEEIDRCFWELTVPGLHAVLLP